jgi:hypothetical protein
VYGIVTFYLAIFFIAKDRDVDFSQIKFGAGIIAGVNVLLLFLWICLPQVWPILWIVIFLVAVFLVYALEAGLIVRHAVIATVLFSVMFLPGLFGLVYFFFIRTNAVH